jgi:hypothetical protein
VPRSISPSTATTVERTESDAPCPLLAIVRANRSTSVNFETPSDQENGRCAPRPAKAILTRPPTWAIWPWRLRRVGGDVPSDSWEITVTEDQARHAVGRSVQLFVCGPQRVVDQVAGLATETWASGEKSRDGMGKWDFRDKPSEYRRIRR